MTAQVGDKFRYKEEAYSVVALSSPVKFTPIEYGIIPHGICSACWRGYWCEYEISDEGIILKDLYIHSKEDLYPAINGVLPQEAQRRSKKWFQYMGHHLYKDVNLKIPYTGRILAGKDFIREYGLNMGFQRAWAYGHLTEFVFADGCLLETKDHSEMAATVRRQIKEDPKGFEQELRKDISKYVDESFSTDMKVKAWWIP